jgi:hypothetical protein
MATFGGVISPEQHLQSQAPDPESLRSSQVMTGPGDTHMTSRTRLHGSILAEPEQLASGYPDVHAKGQLNKDAI